MLISSFAGWKRQGSPPAQGSFWAEPSFPDNLSKHCEWPFSQQLALCLLPLHLTCYPCKVYFISSLPSQENLSKPFLWFPFSSLEGDQGVSVSNLGPHHLTEMFLQLSANSITFNHVGRVTKYKLLTGQSSCTSWTNQQLTTNNSRNPSELCKAHSWLSG